MNVLGHVFGLKVLKNLGMELSTLWEFATRSTSHFQELLDSKILSKTCLIFIPTDRGYPLGIMF